MAPARASTGKPTLLQTIQGLQFQGWCWSVCISAESGPYWSVLWDLLLEKALCNRSLRYFWDGYFSLHSEDQKCKMSGFVTWFVFQEAWVNKSKVLKLRINDNASIIIYSKPLLYFTHFITLLLTFCQSIHNCSMFFLLSY